MNCKNTEMLDIDVLNAAEAKGGVITCRNAALEIQSLHSAEELLSLRCIGSRLCRHHLL